MIGECSAQGVQVYNGEKGLHYGQPELASGKPHSDVDQRSQDVDRKTNDSPGTRQATDLPADDYKETGT